MLWPAVPTVEKLSVRRISTFRIWPKTCFHESSTHSHTIPMPHFRKVERAKVIVQDGVELHLKDCTKCGIEFYGAEDQSACGECGKGRKKTKKKKGGGSLDLPFR